MVLFFFEIQKLQIGVPVIPTRVGPGHPTPERRLAVDELIFCLILPLVGLTGFIASNLLLHRVVRKFQLERAARKLKVD